MTLRFILGRAGTGKTEKCLDEIRASLRENPMGKPIILLVPEQSTFQMEYALATTPDLEGMARAQVLSFRRLAWHILQEIGGAARVPIGELGKRMILRRLLEQNKEHLQVFARSADRPGFSDALARSIGELKIYQIEPMDLEETVSAMTGINLLGDKLKDLGLIYRKLEEYLEGRYTDPDDYLNILIKGLDQAFSVKEAEIWVDGFTGFTPQEFKVLESLMKHAERVNVALCLEPECIRSTLNENDLFYPTWETFREIYRRAENVGVKIEKAVSLQSEPPKRFENNSAFAHLEKAYFKYPLEDFRNCKGFKLSAGTNRRAEVEAVSREIIRLSLESGYRWRDIALLLRDMETYRDLITDIFNDYKIPFFMDCKRNVLHHPLVELVRSVIETVIKNWAYEPLFRCLKTDLLPVAREEIDTLENYILAHGIRGLEKWTGGDWNYRRRYTLGEDSEIDFVEAEELQHINKTREKVVSALAEFSKKVQVLHSTAEMTTALYELFEYLEVHQTLQQWSDEAEDSGNLELAREHIQVWNGIMGLFDEMVEVIGEDQLSLEEYLAVLDSGLENLRLGLIPPGLDQVIIGSMDRSRSSNIKAVFILGANDGILPARQPDEGILNDHERQVLAEAGLVIAPGARRKAFEEQYLIYTALTRAKEYLWLSYPMADEEGGALAPSPIIGRLKAMFPDIEETLYQVEPTGEDSLDSTIEYLVNPDRALAYLAARLRELHAGTDIDAVWWDTYNWFISESEWNQRLSDVLQGVFHVNKEDKISADISRKLYGAPLRASVSRIERFKACPFAHFSAYGLKLKERSLFRLEAPDMGEFFHAALKRFAEKLTENNLDWGKLSPKDCEDFTTKIVDELAPGLQSEILLSTARYRYLTGKLKKTIRRAALVLAEHARRGQFRPVGLEMGFGRGELPPVNVKLADGNLMELVGRIDRVDAAQMGDKYYLRVIDYKSSDNGLTLPEIYHGLRLQLLTYLDVALQHSNHVIGQPGHPAGILYFTVKEPMIKSQGPLNSDKAEMEIMKKLKMKGFLLGDPDVIKMMDNNITSGSSELIPVALNKDGNFRANSPVASVEQFEILRCYLRRLLAQCGEQILSGEVSIEPYQYNKSIPCIYCPFKPVCQFDLLLKDNGYRLISKISNQEVWQSLAEEEGIE